MGDDLDLVVRHAIDVAQQFTALVGHHDDLRGHLDDALHHRALRRRRRGQHRVQRRDDRHGQARQQFQDMGPGFAAENSEFVLQTDDVEPAGVEKRRGVDILLDAVILDLQRDRSRIVIGLVVVGHRHDAGLQVWLANSRPRVAGRSKMLRCRSGEATNCRSPRSCGAASCVRLGQAGEFRQVGGNGLNRSGRLPGKPVQKRNRSDALAGYATRALSPLAPTSMLARPPPTKIACPIDSAANPIAA